MRVLKVLKDSKGNTLINVLIGASLLAGGAILVSQGVVSSRKTSTRLNKASSGQVAAKNIMDYMKTRDNATRTSNVNYYPSNHPFTAADGSTGNVVDHDPKDELSGYNYSSSTPGTNTDPLTIYTVNHSGARYYFAPVWRKDTSALVSSTDWVFEAASAGSFDDEVLDASITDFRASSGLHEELKATGVCGTTNLTAACEEQYENDANIVMANSINTWQSMDALISRMAYFYNEYPDFCTQTIGLPVVTDSNYGTAIDSWIDTNKTNRGDALDFFVDLVDSQLLDIPGAQPDTLQVFLKIEKEDLLSANKATTCSADFEALPPGTQASAGNLTSAGLRVTIQVEYDETDASGNNQTKVAIFSNSFSQSRLSVEPEVLGDPVVTAVPYDTADPYSPVTTINPNGNDEYCGEVREGSGDTGSAPIMEVDTTLRAVAGVPFCRLEYMRPDYGNSFHNGVQFVDAGQPDAAAINSAIEWAMGYKDSGWFLCTMPPRDFQAGFDPEILDITDPFGNSTNSDGKKGLRQMQTDNDLSTVVFENVRTTLDETNQNVKMRIKGLSEGEYKFSVKIVDASRSVSDARSATWKVDLLRPFAITRNIRTVQDSNGRYLVGEFGQPLVGSKHVNGDGDPSNDWVQQLPGQGTRPNEIALLNTLNANFGQSSDGESGELYQCGGGTPMFNPPDQADYVHLYDVLGGGVKWYFGPSRPVSEIYDNGSGDTIEDYFKNGAITGTPDANELLYTDCNLDSSTVVGPLIEAIEANSGEYMVAMQLCDLCGDGAPNQMGFRYWIADFTPQNSSGFTVEVNGGNTSLSSNTFNVMQSAVAPVFEYGIRVQKPAHQVGRYANTKPLPMAAVCEVASVDAPFDSFSANNKDNYTYVTDRFHTNYVIDPVNPTDLYGNPNWVIDPNNQYSSHSFTCSQPNLSDACREDTAPPITGVIAGAAIDACGRFRPDNPPSTKVAIDASTEVNTYQVRGYSAGSGNGRNDRCNQVDCAPGYYCDQVGSVGGTSNLPSDAAGVCRAQDEIVWDRTNSYGGPGTPGGALRRTTMGFLGGSPPPSPACGVYAGTDFIGADCACGWARDCNNNITGLGSCNSAALKCTNTGIDCNANEASAAACLILGTIGGTGISESDISGRPNYINTSTSITAYAPLMSGNTLNPAACLPDANYRGYIGYQTDYSGTGTPAITYAESLSAGESADYDVNGGRCTWAKGNGATCGWEETRDNEHLRHQTNGHEWCVAGTNVYGDWDWTTNSSTNHATCVNFASNAYTNNSCLTQHGRACRDLELKPGQTDYNIGDVINCNNGSSPAPSAPSGTVAWVNKGGPYTCDGDWSSTGSTSCSGGLTWEYSGSPTTCTGTWVAGASSACGGSAIWTSAGFGCDPSGTPCTGGASLGNACSSAGSVCFYNTSCGSPNFCLDSLGANCDPMLHCTSLGGSCPADTCNSLGSPCTIGDTCDEISGSTQTLYSCNDTSSCGSYSTGDIQGDTCFTAGNTTARRNGTAVQNYVCSCGSGGNSNCENLSDGFTDPTSPQVGCTQDTFGKTCSRTDADTTYSYECTGCEFTTSSSQTYPFAASSGTFISDATTLPSCSDSTSCTTLDDAGADGTQNTGYCYDSSTDRIHYRECEVQSCSVPALECNYNETSPNPWSDDSNNVDIDFAGTCIATQGTCDNLPSNAASGLGTDNAYCPNLNPFGVDDTVSCSYFAANYCSGESFTAPDGAGGTLNCPNAGASTAAMECFGDSSNLPKATCSGAPGTVCVPFTDCTSATPLNCEAKVACASDELYYANQADCYSTHGSSNCSAITAYNLAGGYCGRGCPGGIQSYASEASCENSAQPNHDLQCAETRSGSGVWCPATCPTDSGMSSDPKGYSSLTACEDGGTYQCEIRSFINTRTSSQAPTTTQNTTTYPLRTSGTSNPVSLTGLSGAIYSSSSPYCRIRPVQCTNACCAPDVEFYDWSDCVLATGNPASCGAIIDSGTCQDKSGCSGTTYARDDASCVGSTPNVGDSVSASCCSGSGSCYYLGSYTYDRVDNGLPETEELFCTSTVAASATPPTVTPASCSGTMAWENPGSIENFDCATANGGPFPLCQTNTSCGVENEGDYRCDDVGSQCRVRRCSCSGTFTPEQTTSPSTKQWTTGKCADAPERYRVATSTGSGSTCSENNVDRCESRTYSGGLPGVCQQVTDQFTVNYHDGTGATCSGQAVAGEWGACTEYDIPNGGSCPPVDPDRYESIEVYCTPASAVTCTATPNDSSGYTAPWSTSQWSDAETYVTGNGWQMCNGGLSSTTNLNDAGNCTSAQNGSVCYYAYQSGSGPSLYVNDATCSCSGAPSTPATTCSESFCQTSSGGTNNPPSAFTFDIFLGGSNTRYSGDLHVNITSPPTDADGDTLTYTYYFRAGCEDDVATFNYVTSSGTPGPTTYGWTSSGTANITRTQCQLGSSHPDHCSNVASTCTDSSDLGETCYQNSAFPCSPGPNSMPEYTCTSSGGTTFTGDGTNTTTSACVQNQWSIPYGDFTARCTPGDVAEYIVAVSVTDGTDTVWGTSGGQNFASRSQDTLSSNNTSNMCSASTYYRVDCGGSVQTTGPSENGESCSSPHGDACTAAQSGDNMGTATCTEIALDYGIPQPNHGDVTTPNCYCSSCDYGAYVNGDYNSSGISEHYCETPP
ncbi:MAG: hypothetical protein VX642_02660 [Bdellovibrionota bacterium]|nr:hypothetical protein [Bdellovibrionota bacterium]